MTRTAAALPNGDVRSQDKQLHRSRLRIKRHARRYLLAALLLPHWAHSAPWYPVPVIADGKDQSYVPLERTSKPWRICALLPHGQDKFWWGVSWGLSEEAKRLGIKLGLYEAGGYEHLEVQRRQLEHCRHAGADAIVLASVNPDGLNTEVEQAAREHIVVVDLINGISSGKIAARAVSDTALLTHMAARHIVKTTHQHLPTVLWLPGPHAAQWVSNAERGMRAVLTPDVATVLEGGYDIPEPSRQMGLIRTMFRAQATDYVLANAVAAVAAARVIAMDKNSHTKVIAWYANEPVVTMIGQRKIEGAPSNNPVLQARIGLDLAVRALEQQRHPVNVQIKPEWLDLSTLRTFDTNKLYAPPGTWMILQDLPD